MALTPDISETEAYQTFDQLLFMRAQVLGEQPLYTFLKENVEATYSYAELDRRAREIGGWLQARGAAGKPVLLVYPQGLDYIAAFFGCLYAGAIAVPALPPRRNRRAVRICGIVQDCGLSFALTTSELLAQMQQVIADEPSLANLPWQATDQIEPHWFSQWHEPATDGESVAFLQYTSGSTGTPKGVVVSHGNLMHNQQLICKSFRQNKSIVMAGWLPLYHDMGLIGNTLHPLYLGGRFVFMSPTDFLQSPVSWLRMISQHRATIAGGPNFAYQLCVEAISPDACSDIDLSSWQVAYNGAEPVRAQTMREFTARFKPFGFAPESFCPCYGMAETTLLVTGAIPGEEVIVRSFDSAGLEAHKVIPVDADISNSPASEQEAAESPKAAELVACGTPDPTLEVRIVDPETHVECAPGNVGEIWVSGGSVAHGYWGQQEVTDATFHAKIRTNSDGENPVGQMSYLRTGDLGFIHESQLYVTGRLKDVIIVRGANHYPQDIELTVETSHECLARGGGAAFALESAGNESVVVIQELQRSQMRTFDEQQVFAAILSAVAEEHQIPLSAIVLVRPGSNPKTTSGKIQRREARRMYLEGEFKVVASWQRGVDESAASESEAVSNDVCEMVDKRAAAEADVGTTADASLTVEQRSSIQELSDWIQGRLCARLKLRPEELDPRQPFARYGLDSLSAVRLTGELAQHLGRPVPPTLAYDHPTVDALAYFLATGRSNRSVVERARPALAEPLAVIGIGCRFPGGISPHQFWSLLREGRDAISAAPTNRWPNSRSHKLGNDQRGLRGGFLNEVDGFDARFFGISPREADQLDPQQRLLLEIVWETFEDACIPVDNLAGSRTGVFVGASSNDYLRLQSSLGLDTTGYSATGNSLAVIANRISYTFDFRGPSWAVDTACSSSLVAVHQACSSLRRGECDLAVAGGVSLILSPDVTSAFIQAGMLSPDSKCKTFAAGADGFVRGEGCGLVLIKPLSRALADGDRIYSVLRGSAVNQDGRSNGLTAPNGTAQQAVIQAALEDAGVEATQVDFVEAHGTGTELGDPIEFNSLATSYAPDGQRAQTLQIGSVKTNIGHLEAAAGIAGLIKVCLALHHETIPPNLNFEMPSPHIDWSQPLAVPTQFNPWTRSDRPRIAGVSSFGFGGTNAHMIVAEAPAPTLEPANGDPPLSTSQLLTLSARSAESLREHALRFAEAIADAPLVDVALSANFGRTHFKHRVAVRADSSLNAADKLRQFAREGKAQATITGSAERAFSINWLFPGQGGRFVGAGKRLYENCPVFRAELHLAAKALSAHWLRPLTSMLWDEDGACWSEVDVQPAQFCLQYSLARMWTAWGVTPTAVLGHSLGEYAAACIAGVFSFEDALKLVCCRAKLIGGLPKDGRMLAVFASESDVRCCLKGLESALDVAAVNGPRQTVVSGSTHGLNALVERLRSRGIESRALEASHAFHSPLIDPVLKEFAEVAATVSYHTPVIPMISSVTGTWIKDDVACPNYWVRNLREPVRFQTASEQLMAADGKRCLEVGAGSTLSGLIRSAHRGSDITLLPGLTARPNEWEEVLGHLGQLYVAGATIDWCSVSTQQRRPLSLPTYPFERQRHWFSDASPRDEKQVAEQGNLVHPLLGAELDLGTREIVFQTDVSRLDYLADHQVASAVVFPTAGYLELALAAGISAGIKRHEVHNLTIDRPLSWKAGEPCRVQAVLSPEDYGFQCRILRREEAKWQTYAQCRLVPDVEEEIGGQIPSPAGTLVAADTHYDRCREAGLEYGPAFRGVCALTAGEDEAWGQVCLPAEVSREGYHLHPALLDACLQVTAAMMHDRDPIAFLPTQVERYRLICSPEPEARLHVHVRRNSSESSADLQVDIEIGDEGGNVFATIERLTLKPTRLAQASNMLYRDCWLPKIRTAEASRTLPDFAPSEFERLLIGRRETMPESVGLANRNQVLRSLESVSALWVAEALRTLRFEPRTNESFTASELADRLGVVANHHRLFERMLGVLAEEACLRRRGTTWTVLRNLPEGDAEAASKELLEQYPAAKTEEALLKRCGSRLASVLRAETDPLPLLFPNDGSVSAADVYRDSAGGKALNALVATALEPAVAQLVEGRGLRILEIGAGTGATTESVLANLPQDRIRYTFTDVAPGFLSAAKAKLQHYDNIDYRVLDIERDPTEQKFAPASFDIVVAANVLHATEDLRTSLRHVRRLLKPGGILLLVEGTRPVRWLDLTFGLTPGWWRFNDDELRAGYPLLSAAGWRSLLVESGFNVPSIVSPVAIAAGEQDAENSIIVTQLQGEAAENIIAPAGKPSNWLILADDCGIGEGVVSRLHDRGDKCFSALAESCSLQGKNWGRNSIASPGDLTRWIDRVVPEARPSDVVFLWPLDFSNDQLPPDETARLLNDALLELVQGLMKAEEGYSAHADEGLRLWIVTRGAQSASAEVAPEGLPQATLWGFLRTLTLERPDWRCRGIDLDPQTPVESAIHALWDELTAPGQDDESEIAFRQGRRLVRRLVECNHASQAVSDRATTLEIVSRGSIDGLAFGSASRRAPQRGEIEVQVHASGLNFRDLLNLLALYPGTPPLGAECVGIVTRVGSEVDAWQVGDHVAVIAPRSICDFLTVAANFAVKIPEQISSDSAATVPVAFVTASVALEQLGRIRRGDRVLIHSATGGVGLAAIQLARAAGAEIFATASVSKHHVLREMGIRHIYDSRRMGFAQAILEATGGVGVDLVLNSLADEFMPENLRVLGYGKRLLDIAKTKAETLQEAVASRPDVVVHTIDLAAQLQGDPISVCVSLARIFSRIEAGELHALPFESFALSDAPQAFRRMQRAEHVGKILIKPRSAEVAKTSETTASGQRMLRQESAATASLFHADRTYLIAGGLGGLGLAAGQWMASRGARHIALLARREPTPLETKQIAEIEAAGCRVRRFSADVAELAQVEIALRQLREQSPPLAGVFHLAGTLDDSLVAGQTSEKLARVFAPKIRGAWNLHQTTLADRLDWFVLFSSAASMFGSPGQANHAAANAFLDALAWRRRSAGLPGTSINWGPWSRIGAAAKRGVEGRSDLAGIEMIAPEEGWEAFDRLLQPNSAPQVAVVRLNAGALPARLQQMPLFEKLLRQTGNGDEERRRRLEFLGQYRKAPQSEQRRLMLDHLQNLAATTLGIGNPTTISHDEALFDLGLDSLTTLELRSSLESSLLLKVPSSLVFDYPTLHRLTDYFVDALASEEPAQSMQSETTDSEESSTTGVATNYADQDDHFAPCSATVPADHILQLLQRVNNLSAELDYP